MPEKLRNTLYQLKSAKISVIPNKTALPEIFILSLSIFAYNTPVLSEA